MTETREVVKCCNCGLVQFATVKCRRCRNIFSIPEPSEPDPLPVFVPRISNSRKNFAHAFRELRIYRGWSQLDMEKQSGIVRTYISKIERGELMPVPAHVYKLAEVLKIPSPALFFDANLRRDFMSKEILEDSFLSQIALYMPNLRIAEREAILSHLSIRYGVFRVR